MDVTELILSVFRRGRREEFQARRRGQGAIRHDSHAGANETTCV